MYTVASPDPDRNRRGGGQLPNPNECNSTLTSGTKNTYSYPIDVNDRGHRLRSGSPVTNYPCAATVYNMWSFPGLRYEINSLDTSNSNTT